MDEDVRLSRLRVSRRRALNLGGVVSLSSLLAACGWAGTNSGGAASSASGGSTGPISSASTTPVAGAASDIAAALLDEARSCNLVREATQGPYWFDVDAVRSDIREDRPGTALELVLRVQDVSRCSTGGPAEQVPDSVVEIWHCDAGGIYSGFESGSLRDGGILLPPGSSAGQSPPVAGGDSNRTSDGLYSSGEPEGRVTDDGTYLRGAQITDPSGVVRFTTIFPGWYSGRTPHVHLKVHRDRTSVLTSQLYFDEQVIDTVYATAPYNAHPGRDTTNDSDSIYDEASTLTARQTPDGWTAVINLAIDA